MAKHQGSKRWWPQVKGKNFDHQLFHCFDSSFQRTIMELNGKRRFLEKSHIKFPTRKSIVLKHCLYDIYKITYLHRKLLKINATLAPAFFNNSPRNSSGLNEFLISNKIWIETNADFVSPSNASRIKLESLKEINTNVINSDRKLFKLLILLNTIPYC